jgi:hypothetical protein
MYCLPFKRILRRWEEEEEEEENEEDEEDQCQPLSLALHAVLRCALRDAPRTPCPGGGEL